MICNGFSRVTSVTSYRSQKYNKNIKLVLIDKITGLRFLYKRLSFSTPGSLHWVVSDEFSCAQESCGVKPSTRPFRNLFETLSFHLRAKRLITWVFKNRGGRSKDQARPWRRTRGNEKSTGRRYVNTKNVTPVWSDHFCSPTARSEWRVSESINIVILSSGQYKNSTMQLVSFDVSSRLYIYIYII